MDRGPALRATLHALVGAWILLGPAESPSAEPLRGGILLLSSEPAYLAPLVDRMTVRQSVAGCHSGTVLGQKVAIPDLGTPLSDVLGHLPALAESTGSRTAIAIVPGLALNQAALPGDLLIASRILAGEGDDGARPIDTEREVVEALRLAGAEAGFFEVPDVRIGARGGRAPRVLAGPLASASRAEYRDQEGASGGDAAPAALATTAYVLAKALAGTSLEWAILSPLEGPVDRPGVEQSVFLDRGASNAARLLTALLKAIPPEEPPAREPVIRGSRPKAMISLRESPIPSAPVVGTFPRGSRFQVVETTPDGRWNRLTLDDGREGWVLGTTLEREPLVVYTLEERDGFEELAPREYDVDPHEATPARIARAVCHPDDPRVALERGFRVVPLCAGIDSLELVVDTVTVFLGPRAREFFGGANAAQSDRFLARLVHSLTEVDRIHVVRLRFTSPGASLPTQVLRREDFLRFWPTRDLERVAAQHPDPALRDRAAAALSARRR